MEVSTHAQHLLQERTTPYAGGENDIQARGEVSIKVNKHNMNNKNQKQQ
jgi:hypothetical protein